MKVFMNAFFASLLLYFQLPADQPSGRVLEDLEIKSKNLDKTVRYAICLPFDYDSSNRFYFVVYLLHGYKDDDVPYLGNSRYHILFLDLGIPHDYLVYNGGQQWKYWRTGLNDDLVFIGTSFHQH